MISNKERMYKHLLKWGLASLGMPILVLIFGRALNSYFILVFWPSSIGLMSLGAEANPFQDVIYVWTVTVGLNILLYLAIGSIVLLVKNILSSIKGQSNARQTKS